MSELSQNLKNIVIKGIEAIGSTAESIASSTKQKVEEFNLVNQIKDIYAEIGGKVVRLSEKGILFPEEIERDLEKVRSAEKELNRLREQKEEVSGETGSETKEDSEPEDEKNAPFAEPLVSEYAANDNKDIPVIQVEDADNEEIGKIPENTPLSNAINELFEKMPPVDEMADKVNSTLDELGNSILKASNDFDKQLKDFSDKMMGKNEQD